MLIGLPNSMLRQNRQIILLMDNATSHKKIDSLTNIVLHFLQPRTSVLQPCDAGIISAFKSHYKRMFIQNRVDAYDASMDNNTESTPFTIKDAIYTVANAWDRVSQQVIVNCWQKTRILFLPSSTSDEIEETEQALEEEWIDNCVSMESLFNELPYDNRMSVESNIKCIANYLYTLENLCYLI